MGYLFLVDGLPLLAAMFFTCLGVIVYLLETINDWAVITDPKNLNKRIEILKSFVLALIMTIFIFDFGVLGVDYGALGFGLSYGAIGYGGGRGLPALFDIVKPRLESALHSSSS